MILLARTAGYKTTELIQCENYRTIQAECLFMCQSHDVKITFSCSNLWDMTYSIREIPKVGVQLPKWWVPLHAYVEQYVQVEGEGGSCATFSPNSE